MAPSVAEAVHCHQALVAAELAALHLRLEGQPFQSRRIQKRAPLITSPALPGDQGGAEGPHDAGDLRPHRLTARHPLEGAQHSIVLEGSPLNDNMLAQFLGVADLDNLVQGIMNDRVGQAGGNLADSRPFLLRLLHLGIHEDGAAGAQIQRLLGQQGVSGKLLHIHLQGFGE
ncbi:hypothetical protein D3C75_934950 [compost metagenome]